jgi:hypothetical protein
VAPTTATFIVDRFYLWFKKLKPPRFGKASYYLGTHIALDTFPVAEMLLCTLCMFTVHHCAAKVDRKDFSTKCEAKILCFFFIKISDLP